MKLSLLLGAAIVIGNAISLCFNYQSIFEFVIPLAFLIWSPVSLWMMFKTPKRYVMLPIGYMVGSAVFCACTAFLVTPVQPRPAWVFIGFLAIGLFQAVYAACILIRERRSATESAK